MFLNHGLAVIEVYLDLAGVEQVISTETEAYTRAKVVMHRQTARDDNGDNAACQLF